MLNKWKSDCFDCSDAVFSYMLGNLWFATPNRGNCKRMANSDNNMAAIVDGEGTAKRRGPEKDEAEDESSDR